MNVPSGNPCACVNMQLEIKPGTKKKFVRNKAIPSRAREPAALAIYAPLSHFHRESPVKTVKVEGFPSLAQGLTCWAM